MTSNFEIKVTFNYVINDKMKTITSTDENNDESKDVQCNEQG